MKHLGYLNLALSALLVTACSNYEKDPVPDLQKMRESAKVQDQNNLTKPQVIVQPGDVVIKEVAVSREESAVTGKSVVLKMDPQMVFSEGKAATYKIQVRSIVPGVKWKLSAQGLPDGASLNLESSKGDQDIYALTWTAPLYTVSENDASKVVPVTLNTTAVSANSQKQLDSLRGLVNATDVYLTVVVKQDLPPALKVTGITSDVSEGDVVTFSVIAKLPGFDDKAPSQPDITIYNDALAPLAGSDVMEMPGAGYVMPDATKTKAEYLGDFTWKFTRIFDTKNNPVQAQLGKDGKVVASAATTQVRFNVKVYGRRGVSTPEKTVQIKIKHAAPSAPAGGQ